MKLDLREFLNKVYKDTNGKVSSKDWEDFEVLFWKIYPLIQEEYIPSNEEKHNDYPIVPVN